MVTASDAGDDRLVLLFNSDPRLSQVLSASLNTLGIRVRTARNPQEVEALVKKTSPAVFLADLDGNLSPQQIIKTVHLQPKIKLIVTISERLKDDLRAKLAPDQVIYKPFDSRYVCRKIKQLLSQS